MVRTVVFIAGVFLLASCSKPTATTGPLRHYALSGKITAIDKAHQVATIDAAAMPGFMDAMTMDYPVASKSEFDKLRVGEQITGTVDVGAQGEYTVSSVHEKTASETH